MPVRSIRGLDLDHLTRGRERAHSRSVRRLQRGDQAGSPATGTNQIEGGALGPVGMSRGTRPEQLPVETEAQRQCRAVIGDGAKHHAVRHRAGEPLDVLKEGIREPVRRPAARRGYLDGARGMPGQLEQPVLGPAQLDGVEQVSAGDERAGDLAPASAGPTPSLADVEGLAQRGVRRLRMAVEPRRVVRERGAVPEEILADVRPGARIGEPMMPVRVERQVQAVGMTVAAAESAALEARIAGAVAQDREALVFQQRRARRPGLGGVRQRRRHLQQRPPGEVGPGARPRGGRLAGLMQIRVEGLGARRRRLIELPEPAPEIRAGVARAGKAHLPELEVHGLRERHPEARVLAGGKGVIGEGGHRRRPERRGQSRGQPLVREQVDVRMVGPAHRGELTAEREEVVVLTLVPHPVLAESAYQVREHPRRALDHASRQLLVLEPDGDRRQRGVVPGLPVGEALIELADEVGGLLGQHAHAPGQVVGQVAALAQQHGGGEIVGEPHRLEVGREEQPARAQHGVAIGVGEVRRGIGRQDFGRASRGAGVPREAREGPERRRALGEPEMLKARPGAVVALAGERPAAAGAAVG